MRAPISVVIPTLNAGDALAPTLGALTPGLKAGLIRELVISDGGSLDETRAVAQAAGAVWIPGTPGRGGQLRRGAEAAGGDWLLFLHADTHLSADWADAALAHLESDKAGVFRLAFRAKGLAPWLVAGWANLRTRLGLPYGDQGLLISRALYDAVGGFPDQPLMEDVAMARALKRQITILPATAETSAERYQQDGWLLRGAGNLLTLARYLAGADPQKLARRYSRR